MGILAVTTTAALIASRAINEITPAITTAFKPAATCLDNKFTMMENKQYEIWLNYPLPVPKSTFSACYPPQFMSSVIDSAAGTTQVPFSPLVCPQGYTTVESTWRAASNYIACCPSEYGLALDDAAPSTRPALNAKCYTNLPFGSTVQMTVYGKSSLSNINAFSISASTMQAYAIPYEGYGGKSVSPTSVPATTTSSSSASKTTSSGSTSRVSSTVSSAATHTIVATNTFVPNTINAQAGDAVLFQFRNGNHSITQSTFDTPCEPLAGGVDSGFKPNPDSLDPFPSYEVRVRTSDPQWFYSKGVGDCPSGMAFGLNPNSAETMAEFLRVANAEASPPAETESKPSGGTSKGVKIGVSVGVVVFVLLIAAGVWAFFIHRRRKAIAAAPPVEIGAGQDHYAAENKGYKNHELPTPGTGAHELASNPHHQELAELANLRYN